MPVNQGFFEIINHFIIKLFTIILHSCLLSYYTVHHESPEQLENFALSNGKTPFVGVGVSTTRARFGFCTNATAVNKPYGRALCARGRTGRPSLRVNQIHFVLCAILRFAQNDRFMQSVGENCVRPKADSREGCPYDM